MEQNIIYTITLLLISLFGIWIGSGLIIRSVENIAKKIHASSFLVSFFLLGFLTTTPDIAIAINSYFDQTLDISVGNLLGGVLFIFLFTMPILALIGNGIKLGHRFHKVILIIAIITILMPSFFLLDGQLQKRESLVILSGYLISSLLVILNMNSMKNIRKIVNNTKKINPYFFLPLMLGSLILFISCDVLVNEVTQIAIAFNISPFIISLLGLSVGTNLPELSLAIKSVIQGKNEIAFGDYLGSSLMSVIILAILGIANNRIVIAANFLSIFIFSAIGLGLFYVFILSKHNLSKKEGLVLLSVYLLFLVFEIFIK